MNTLSLLAVHYLVGVSWKDIERDSIARTFALTRAKLSLPYKLEVLGT